MAAQGKEVCKFNAMVVITERVSQKGNTYKAIELVVNGKTVPVGFCGDSQELSLLKAGVKFAE